MLRGFLACNIISSMSYLDKSKDHKLNNLIYFISMPPHIIKHFTTNTFSDEAHV